MTRLANFPASEWTIIAIAPWISAPCTRSYLSAATKDKASALLVYLVDGVNLKNQTEANPPPADDKRWSLDDKDAWKSQNQYPVYAINANVGSLVMTQLGL